jgi:nitrogen PTS system EIIA component
MTTAPGTPAGGEVMTVPEVAHYLKIAEKSVLRMVHRGELPATKVASQWRFLRPAIEAWLRARMQPGRGAVADGIPGLSSLLPAGGCILDLRPGSKEEVLRQLAAPLDALGEPPGSGRLVERLRDRESMFSTGIGQGIAIPHLRNPLEWVPRQPRLIFGRCRQGVAFDALDGVPVTLFFLPRPLNEVHHVRIMARLGDLLRDERTRAALGEAERPGDVERILLRHDQMTFLSA